LTLCEIFHIILSRARSLLICMVRGSDSFASDSDGIGDIVPAISAAPAVFFVSRAGRCQLAAIAESYRPIPRSTSPEP
jgi:hypothetical protein